MDPVHYPPDQQSDDPWAWLPFDPSDAAGYIEAPDHLDELIELIAQWTRAADRYDELADSDSANRLTRQLVAEGVIRRRTAAMLRLEAIRERLAIAAEAEAERPAHLRATDDALSGRRVSHD